MGRTTTMRGHGPAVHHVEKGPRINTDGLRSSRGDAEKADNRSVMQSEVQILERHLQELEDQLRGLGERLVPVLLPPSPNDAVEMGLLEDAESTPLSRFMRAMSLKVRSLSISVQDLRDRVDL